MLIKTKKSASGNNSNSTSFHFRKVLGKTFSDKAKVSHIGFKAYIGTYFILFCYKKEKKL